MAPRSRQGYDTAFLLLLDAKATEIQEDIDDLECGNLLKFADYCSKFGGMVYSVDIDSEAVALSSWMVSRKYPDVEVNVIHSDSVAFLESFDEPIDVLYLDSDNDANLILNEAKAALCNLHSESIVLIDDCFSAERKETHKIEKGDLVIPFLEENGWVKEVKAYQVLFVHEDRF